MHVSFFIWQCPDIQVIAIHAFPKIYLDMKMLFFVAKNENILASLYMYIRQNVLSLIILHQIENKINNNYKF